MVKSTYERLALGLRGVKTERVVAVALYLAWVVVYLHSLDLHGRNFDYENFLFDADGPRIVKVLTVPGAAFSSHRHPLYVAMLQPLGLALDAILVHPIRAALGVTAALAALGSPLAFVVLRRSAGGLLDGLLWAILFSGSSCIWLFASMPETFAINVTTIVLGYVLQLTPEGPAPAPGRFRRKFAIHVLYGTLATGITLTNSVYAFISFCSLAWKHRHPGKWLRFLFSTGLYVVCVTAFLAALSKLQSLRYPDAHRFTAPSEFTGVVNEDEKFFVGGRMLSWLTLEARTFFAHSIIAPRAEMTEVLQYNPRLWPVPPRWQIVQFAPSPGWMFWACTGFALAFCIALGVRSKAPSAPRARWGPEIAMSCAVIAFNLALHSFYRAIGAPLMYATHVVFPILFLLSVLYGRSALPGKRALLLILTVGVLGTNVRFLADVNGALRDADPSPFRVPYEGRVVGDG